jgi:glycosyltransferase involved in cell wall biosynthesis
MSEPSELRVAYLVNRYPSVSHTFIRREIAELEALGSSVLRVSIRPQAREALQDECDVAELQRTQVLLAGGVGAVARHVLAVAFARPQAWLRTLGDALRLGWRSERGVLRHVAYFAEACVLERRLAAAGVDHLHAHFGTNPTAVALLCHALGGPRFSFTAHGTESFDHPAFIKLGRKIDAACFAAAVCDYGRAQLLRCAPPSAWSKIHVVRCGLDASFLDGEVGAVPGTPRLVCVGRFGAEKGHLVLLEAAAALVEAGVEFELTLVGDGELQGAIRARIDALGLATHVHLAGALAGAGVRKQIVDARALVLPSLAEGLPVALTEALALGRPVIATAVGGISELVEPGRNGWLVPPASATALAAAMREALVAPPACLEEMGRRGRAKVREHHDARVEARKLLTLMQRAASAAGTP